MILCVVIGSSHRHIAFITENSVSGNRLILFFIFSPYSTIVLFVFYNCLTELSRAFSKIFSKTLIFLLASACKKSGAATFQSLRDFLQDRVCVRRSFFELRISKIMLRGWMIPAVPSAGLTAIRHARYLPFYGAPFAAAFLLPPLVFTVIRLSLRLSDRPISLRRRLHPSSSALGRGLRLLICAPGGFWLFIPIFRHDKPNGLR